MKKHIKLLIVVLAVIVIGIILFSTLYYTMQLSLSLIGEKNITVGLNALYEDEGAKAIVHGKDASDQIKVSGKVDTAKPGTYTLTYKVDTLTIKRTVVVTDKMEPQLILKGDTESELLLGEKFEEPGYSAVCDDGRDITDTVKVTGVELNKAGKNIIKYTVSDGKGNTTQLTRNVNVLPNTEYETAGLPICMYHYVYDENNPPEDLDARYGNYISQQDLEEELTWLKEENYYFPTWKEVRQFVDGEILLPEKSVVLCFDDGSRSFLEYGIPILEKCEVPATCFMITANSGEEKIAEYASDYVTYESHSDNMHRGGGNIGHGGIFTVISPEEGIADLKKSIEICGSSDAFAYPYGDYNESSKAMVTDAGFLCAVTTENSRTYPGDDPLLLPRVRMSNGQTFEDFKYMIEPADYYR